MYVQVARSFEIYLERIDKFFRQTYRYGYVSLIEDKMSEQIEERENTFDKLSMTLTMFYMIYSRKNYYYAQPSASMNAGAN